MRPRRLQPLAGAITFVLLSWIAIANAAEANVCEIVAKPASFNHQSVTLQGYSDGFEGNHFAPRQRLYDIQATRSQRMRCGYHLHMGSPDIEQP
jgi:hypothetical protein